MSSQPKKEQSSQPPAFRQLSRHYIKSVWDIAQRDIHSLDEEERLLAFIMRDHEEFREVWENMDQHLEKEFQPGVDVDPFLHVTLHHILENQIRSQDPPEVERVFQALKDKGLERPKALHMMGVVLLEHMLQAMEHDDMFDMQTYLRDLILLPMKM
ncbi:DUF1841 family protein [Candidatus Sumerlaeota bacterium]|nr:DUF1841 family protein [Candidatus Sumerlaeota bacterium]